MSGRGGPVAHRERGDARQANMLADSARGRRTLNLARETNNLLRRGMSKMTMTLPTSERMYLKEIALSRQQIIFSRLIDESWRISNEMASAAGVPRNSRNGVTHVNNSSRGHLRPARHVVDLTI